MEFRIKQGASLPILKMKVLDDGRHGDDELTSLLPNSAIFFNMVESSSGKPRIWNKRAYLSDIIENGERKGFYVFVKFSEEEVAKEGRYEGEFVVRTQKGTLLAPIREKLHITIHSTMGL